MSRIGTLLRRGALPAVVFVGVLALHFVWLQLFPERDPVQAKWVGIAASARESGLNPYVETQSYWLGFSYAASLSFAVAAFRRYRASPCGAARNAAIGGVSLTGALAVVGCYLLGCCGSPMLAVYLNLFGSRFMPFAKPLVAIVTGLSLLLGWWWMNRTLDATRCGCTRQPSPSEQPEQGDDQSIAGRPPERSVGS